MGLLCKLLEWQSPQPTRAARKWVPNTNPIDVPAIAKALRLKEEGTRLGRAGVPEWPKPHRTQGAPAAVNLAVEWTRIRRVARMFRFRSGMLLD